MAVISSWTRAGHPVAYAHFTDGADLRWVRPMLHAYRRFPAGTARDPMALDAVAAWLQEQGAALCAAVPYALNAALAARLGRGVTLAAPEPAQLKILQRKSLQLGLAAEVGLAFDPYWLLDDAADADTLPDDIFPIVVRPDCEANVRPPLKAEMARSRAELRTLLVSRQPPYGLIVQRFRNAPNLVVHGSRRADGAHGPIGGFVVDWKYEGVTQRMRPIDLPRDFAARADAFADRLCLVGAYHFEFLLADPIADSPFLDFNGRLGGTTGKALTLGFDEPLMLAWALGAIETPPPYRPRQRAYASNSLALARRAAGLARKRRHPLDYPPLDGVADAVRTAWGLVAWRDELRYRRNWRLVADYLEQGLGT